MREYELMMVLDPNLEEAAVEAISQRVTSIVTQRGGSVRSVEAWGRRRLAYPIGRFRDGIYTLMRFEGSADAGAEIERVLGLTESVIRHLLVRSTATAAAPARS